MAEWDRNNPWRQGHVLPHDAATALSLLHSESPDDTLVVVVSHDCDLACDPMREPNMEVIIARRIEKADGSCTHSKNARKLHLEFMSQGGSIFAELQATKKISLVRTTFQPCPNISPSRQGPHHIAVMVSG